MIVSPWRVPWEENPIDFTTYLCIFSIVLEMFFYIFPTPSKLPQPIHMITQRRSSCDSLYRSHSIVVATAYPTCPLGTPFKDLESLTLLI